MRRRLIVAILLLVAGTLAAGQRRQLRPHPPGLGQHRRAAALQPRPRPLADRTSTHQVGLRQAGSAPSTSASTTRLAVRRSRRRRAPLRPPCPPVTDGRYLDTAALAAGRLGGRPHLQRGLRPHPPRPRRAPRSRAWRPRPRPTRRCWWPPARPRPVNGVSLLRRCSAWAGLLVAGAVVAYWLARRFSRPLIAAAAATGRIAGGDLDARMSRSTRRHARIRLRWPTRHQRHGRPAWPGPATSSASSCCRSPTSCAPPSPPSAATPTPSPTGPPTTWPGRSRSSAPRPAASSASSRTCSTWPVWTPGVSPSAPARSTPSRWCAGSSSAFRPEAAGRRRARPQRARTRTACPWWPTPTASARSCPTSWRTPCGSPARRIAVGARPEDGRVVVVGRRRRAGHRRGDMRPGSSTRHFTSDRDRRPAGRAPDWAWPSWPSWPRRWAGAPGPSHPVEAGDGTRMVVWLPAAGPTERAAPDSARR